MAQQYGTVKVDVITYTSGTGGSETDASITVSSLATISRTGITVTGDINANNIYISGAAQVSGLATVSGLIVGNDATITGNLIVGSGISTSSLVVQNNATVSGALNVSGLATVSGLTVTGDTSLNTLTVTGDINASGIAISGFSGLFESGTKSSPSISFIDDEDTGFYNLAPNEIGMSASGIEVIKIGPGQVTISGTTATEYYPVIQNTSDNGWFKLGHFEGEQGARLKITFHGCEGFGQQGLPFTGDTGGETYIFASILNNQRTDNANIAGMIYAFGTSIVSEVKFVETTDEYNFDIYAKLNNFARAGYYYQISKGNFEWDIQSGQSDPGSRSTTIGIAAPIGTAKTFELVGADYLEGCLGVGVLKPKGNVDVYGDYSITLRDRTDAYIRNVNSELYSYAFNDGGTSYAGIQSQIYTSTGTLPNTLLLNTEVGGNVSIGQIPDNSVLFTTSISGQNNTKFIDRTPYTLTGNTYHGTGVVNGFQSLMFTRSEPEPEWGVYDSVAGSEFLNYRVPNNSGLTTDQPILSLLENSEGNIGINTRNPRYPVTIYGPTQSGFNLEDGTVDDYRSQRASIKLMADQTTNGVGGALLFGNNQSNAAKSLGYAAIKGALDSGANNTTGTILFQTRQVTTDTSLTTSMLLNPNGRLGVGTLFKVPRNSVSDPNREVQATLHVKGDTQVNIKDPICTGSVPADPWIKLGTWSSSQGARLKIDFLGGESFGMPFAVGGETQLCLSSNNNSDETELNCNGFYNFNGREPFKEVKVKQVGAERYKFEIYVRASSFGVVTYNVTTGYGSGNSENSFVKENVPNLTDPGPDSATVRKIYPAVECLVGSGNPTPPNITQFKVNGTIEATNGFKFGNTGGTVTSKTLDDYEEGTFTPTFGGSTTAPTGTYNVNGGGTYTKVGQLVTACIRMRFDCSSTGAGGLTIEGLPFTSANNSSRGNATIGSATQWGSGGTTGAPRSGVLRNNTSSIALTAIGPGNGSSLTCDVSCLQLNGGGGTATNSNNIELTISYFTSS